MNKSAIKISTNGADEMIETMNVDSEIYQLQTEDTGMKIAKIITRIYRKGQIINSMVYDYKHLANLPNIAEELKEIMINQHSSVKQRFIKEKEGTRRSKSSFYEETITYLANNDKKLALDTTVHALKYYSSDPFMLSCYGYLIAAVDRKYREGISICEEAITNLRLSRSTNIVLWLPRFYLNLGRAYLLGRRRKDAYTALKEGLRYDSSNAELNSELSKFGTRQSPVLSFLPRSHPINIRLGKIRHRLLQK